MIRRITLLVVTLILSAVSGAVAVDLIHSRGEGFGQTVLLSYPTPSELLRVPGGGFSVKEWRVESGYDRQFGLSDLDQMFVAGAYRWGKMTASAGLSTFGKSELYSELTGKLGLAYHLDSLVLGASFSGLMVQFGGGYDDLSTATFGLSASYRLPDLLLAASADNITSPRLYDDAVPIDPIYSVYGEYRGRRSFSITGRATVEKGEGAQLGLGQKIRVSRRSAVYWGLSTEPFKFGGGLELGVGGGQFSFAFSNHPDLGFTHTLSISYGGGYRPVGSGDDFK